jgi:hypothetical protein
MQMPPTPMHRCWRITKRLRAARCPRDFGQILDALIDQRHQRRQLVGGDTHPGLQDRHHALAEQQGIVGVGHVPLLPLQVVAPIVGARTKSRPER